MEPNQYNIIRIFLTLFVAHILGDFIFQTKNDIKNKKKFYTLLKHASIIGLLSLIMMGSLKAWPIALTIALTHLIIDFLKLRCINTAKFFILDQCIHVIIIGIISVFVSKYCLWDNSFWNYLINEHIFLKLLIIITGVIINTRVCGIIISKLTKEFLEQIHPSQEASNNKNGLKKGGKIIGYLERLLILIFIFANQPFGIGFLIAAKSILRFGEIKDSSNRKEAEYIIIGSFYSYLFGLIVSYTCKYLFVNI
ncbi:MAG TPA: DUF3307 domain-containing protein [Candidatus Cloacimonetes bacterium]|nr:DUF3307 domain-containing protein [Candidatus Cloacimonadota bacterium]